MPFPWLTEDMPKPIPPAEGPYPDLALIVRELVKGLTLRQAANRTGGKVSHDTIRRAMDGQRVTPEKLDALAFAFDANPNELRHAAGHGLLPNYPHPVSGEIVKEPDREQASRGVRWTPEGIRVDLTYPDGRPVPLPNEFLRRIDFEAKLMEEKSQTE